MCVRSPLPRVLDHGYVSMVVRIRVPVGTIFRPQSRDWLFGGNRLRSRCPGLYQMGLLIQGSYLTEGFPYLVGPSSVPIGLSILGPNERYVSGILTSRFL